jgi:hypothetical protein
VIGLQGRVSNTSAGNWFVLDSPIYKGMFPYIRLLPPIPNFPFMIYPAHIMWAGLGWAIRDSIPSRGNIYFCPPKCPDRLRSHPIFYSIGTCSSFFRSKAGEAHRLPSSGAEAKNAWSCASIHYAFVMCSGTTLLFPLPVRHYVNYTWHAFWRPSVRIRYLPLLLNTRTSRQTGLDIASRSRMSWEL